MYKKKLSLKINFETYENRASRQITIHLETCGYLRQRGSANKSGHSVYTKHADFKSAKIYALKTGYPLLECRCLKNARILFEDDFIIDKS